MTKYLLALTYCLVIFAANVMASTFFQVGFLLVAAGTLFFGAIFTLRDFLHAFGGRRFVYQTIAVALIINVIGATITETPFRIIAASFISLFLSEAADTEVYHHYRMLSWIQRVLRSNAVSIPLDTLLFTSIAFAGVLPFSDFWSLITGDIITKFIIASLVALLHLTGQRFIAPKMSGDQP